MYTVYVMVRSFLFSFLTSGSTHTTFMILVMVLLRSGTGLLRWVETFCAMSGRIS